VDLHSVFSKRASRHDLWWASLESQTSAQRDPSGDWRMASFALASRGERGLGRFGADMRPGNPACCWWSSRSASAVKLERGWGAGVIQPSIRGQSQVSGHQDDSSSYPSPLTCATRSALFQCTPHVLSYTVTQQFQVPPLLPISRVAVRNQRASCLPNLFKMNIFRVTLVFALLLGVALSSAPDCTIATSISQRCYSDNWACLRHRTWCSR